MTKLTTELTRHADHPAVQAASGVWSHLAAAIGLNAAFTLAAMVPLILAAGGALLPAVLLGIVLIGAALGVVVDAAGQMVGGQVHLSARSMPAAARRGIALALPIGLCLLALQAAWHMSQQGAGTGVRLGAIGVDLLVLGTLVVILPAAAVTTDFSRRSVSERYRVAAELTGRRPIRALECLALLVAVVGVGVHYPLIALLIGPTLVAAFVLTAFAPASAPTDD